LAVSCPGVLLTGGTSRRLGVDKSTLVFEGETFAARAARVLRAVCNPVVEVGPGVSGLPSVREDPPGTGPLAALIAGAAALDSRGPVVLLACDLPFVEAPLLAMLAEWPGAGTVIPVSGRRPQYVCARYGRSSLAEAREWLSRGDASLRSAADRDAEFVDEAIWQRVAPAHALADVDTPGDAARLGLDLPLP
jgi:molybdenum cofactor guanylyltransferase